MKKDKFDSTYNTLKNELDVKKRQFYHNDDGTIVAQKVANSFYQLSCLSPEEKYDSNANSGWKFHISLGTERNYQHNLEKAWKIVSETAQKQGFSIY